jgi:D-glycerate 3-kinase
MSPLADAVLTFCQRHLAHADRRPLVVGVQGPQGAGKTTATRALIDALPAAGLTGTTVSVDDFYMTRAGQLAIADAHPGHPCLEHRGYPGTHDISLGEKTLAALRTGAGPVAVPVYDKSAHGGRGDRMPESAWRVVPPPLDLVLVEGWMLGFEPAAETALDTPWLVEPNRALAAYAAWHRLIDVWVVLRARDPEYVLTWRVEAEEKMKASGKPGLSRADIEDYIRRFLPAYRTWGGAPKNVPADRVIEFTVDLDRTTHRSR